jgi:hypothetical protein
MPMRLRVDAYSLIPILRPLTEPLTHLIEGRGVPRDPELPCTREFGGFVGTNPSTVARVIEDLKRSGYRPLRPPENAPLSSISGCPPPSGTPAETVNGRSFGGAINPVEEDAS